MPYTGEPPAEDAPAREVIGWLREQGLSLAQIKARTGLSRSGLASIVMGATTGTRSRDTLRALAGEVAAHPREARREQGSQQLRERQAREILAELQRRGLSLRSLALVLGARRDHLVRIVAGESSGRFYLPQLQAIEVWGRSRGGHEDDRR